MEELTLRFPFSSVSLHRESLLHLAVRWGLPKLFHFLLCLPGGVKALELPNEEGTTPLDLALQGGHSTLVEDITKWVQLLDSAFLNHVYKAWQALWENENN